MFDFKPSATLVEKILVNLKREHERFKIAFPDELFQHIERLRDSWGRSIVGHIGMHAHRTRYEPAESFTILIDGKFSPMFNDQLGIDSCIPPGAAGDALIDELGEELLAWMKEHASTVNLSPRAPITKFVVEGRNLVAHVRPRDPPPPIDPEFTLAEIVE